jgi:hypothetical protein
MGLGIAKVYKHNTDRGIYSVIPVKGNMREPQPGDRERVDRHGIEGCENCGGPTKRISFQEKP